MIDRWLRRWLRVPSVRAIRGAITVEENCETAIAAAVAELIHELQAANGIGPEQMISAVFTMTPDLNAAFPATTARFAGWEGVPLLCATEIAVPGALPRCLRILVHAERCWSGPVRPVYLRGAAALRPDLVGRE
ncbi:MAG TPA: chorismate mutase [Gemmatimonadales bacterium]|jgi:chorismate mutase